MHVWLRVLIGVVVVWVFLALTMLAYTLPAWLVVLDLCAGGFFGGWLLPHRVRTPR